MPQGKCTCLLEVQIKFAGEREKKQVEERARKIYYNFILKSTRPMGTFFQVSSKSKYLKEVIGLWY